MPILRSIAATALTLAALSLLPACTQQRSLLAVREHGERALEYGRYDEALADFEEYVSREPANPRARAGYGKALLGVGKPAQAREQLYIAYSQRLNDDDTVEALAAALAANGQKDDLYKLLRTRALDRGRTEDYLRLAKYSLKMGDADQARQALITAARIDGGKSTEFQLALVDYYEQRGDRTRAVERLRMAYYLNPGNQKIVERVRAFGEVPGPTFGVQPSEQVLLGEPTKEELRENAR